MQSPNEKFGYASIITQYSENNMNIWQKKDDSMMNRLIFYLFNIFKILSSNGNCLCSAFFFNSSNECIA